MRHGLEAYQRAAPMTNARFATSRLLSGLVSLVIFASADTKYSPVRIRVVIFALRVLVTDPLTGT